MKLRVEVQSTCSFCLALAIFSFNVHAVSLPSGKTGEKRRQRTLFRMSPTSGPPDATGSVGQRNSDGENNASENKLDFFARRKSTLEIKGEKSDGPPLIDGSKQTQLTLTLMGKFKNTWCKTENFKQLIKEPGCEPAEVLNRFCYGQCNSFYIPRTLRKRTKRKVFKSCGVCKPKRTHTTIVLLKCPGRKKGYKQKKVRTVKECQCMERWPRCGSR